VDPTGTLYIGAATNGLDGRLGSLVTTHRGHGGGNHIPLPEKLKQRFPPERLRIVWEVCAGDPYTREGELKGAYEDEFGERPPHDRA
jgi:hypothetical protein